MRGLKQLEGGVKACMQMSHLLQMRGLKLLIGGILEIGNVASFTDAWIETVWGIDYSNNFYCRIFYRCVD